MPCRTAPGRMRRHRSHVTPRHPEGLPALRHLQPAPGPAHHPHPCPARQGPHHGGSGRRSGPPAQGRGLNPMRRTRLVGRYRCRTGNQPLRCRPLRRTSTASRPRQPLRQHERNRQRHQHQRRAEASPLTGGALRPVRQPLPIPAHAHHPNEGAPGRVRPQNIPSRSTQIRMFPPIRPCPYPGNPQGRTAIRSVSHRLSLRFRDIDRFRFTATEHDSHPGR